MATPSELMDSMFPPVQNYVSHDAVDVDLRRRGTLSLASRPRAKVEKGSSSRQKSTHKPRGSGTEMRMCGVHEKKNDGLLHARGMDW